MLKYWYCALLFRLVLPCIIASAVFVRPTITSYIYMMMGCYTPFYSIPTARSMAGGTGVYMKCLIIVCLLSCTMVYGFYFILFFLTDYGHDLKPCSSLEITLRTIGVIEYKGLPLRGLVVWCFPEPLVLLTSLLSYLIFKKLTQSNELSEARGRTEDAFLADISRRKLQDMMLNFGKYLVWVLLCLTAVFKATALGVIYYVMFLGILTYWACNKSLGKVYARILTCLTLVVFLHLTIVIFFQFQYFQDSPRFTTSGFWGRFLDLVDLTTYQNCDDPRLFQSHTENRTAYVKLLGLFFLYNISILVARQIFEVKDGIVNLVIAFFYFERGSSARWRRVLRSLKKDYEKKKLRGSNLMVDRVRTAIQQILQFVMSIAYLIGNSILMVWTILYISWISLVLLILANLIWLLPARKKIMLTTSPFLVVFVLFLLLTNYLYSLNLTDEELPLQKALLDVNYDPVRSSSDKWKELLTKSLFGTIIIITMRQLWEERLAVKQEMELEIILKEASGRTTLVQEMLKATHVVRFQNLLIKFFCVWWIWIVIFTMICMEFWSTSNPFRITFVGLAMLFLTTFQLCPFDYWKKSLWFYWWIVIVYAMFNLLVIYMYQIDEVRMFLHGYISAESFERWGFEVWIKAEERVPELAKPLFFQIAIVIQQNYFQREFNKVTSPISPEEVELDENELADSDSKWKKLISNFRSYKDVLFAILEVHLDKVILLIGWFMCLFDLCAIFVPFVMLSTAACVFGKRVATIVIYFTSVFVQAFIIVRLVYMNLYREHKKWNYVGYYKRNGELYNVTLNSADWLGFHESALGYDRADFLQLMWCFGFVFVVTLHRIVTIRMGNYRLSRNLQQVPNVVLFPDITYENCHSSTKDLLKFLANYGFYKFGCEITMVYASVVMGLRMDATSITASVFLLMMFSLNRRWMRRFWLVGIVIVAVVIPVQYMSTLGWWPTFFDRSLTKFWNSNDFRLRLQQFCHFTNMAHPPAKEKISLDFLLLLLMSRQWLAFKVEWKYMGQDWAGGSNENVAHLLDDSTVKNPVPDFVTYSRAYLDGYKRVFFTTWFYLSMIAVFLAGTMRPTLYSFGYLLGAFNFLWEGCDLYLRPPKQILLRWNLLIAYNLLIMMTTTTSQIFGCILKYETHIHLNCPIYRLFTIGCVDKFEMTKDVPNVSKLTSCEVNYQSLGLGWDCFSFFCLILQQRIFKSFHFFHIVNNVKAHTILGDQGAGLIEEDRRRRRQAIDNERNAIERNIKKKMERLKANASKLKAIRAGDYSQFDEVEKDTDIPLLPPKEEEEEEYDSYDPMPLLEYFGLFHATDMKTVLEISAMRRRRKQALMKMGPKKGGVKRPKSSTSASDSETLSTTMNVLRFLWGGFESCIVSFVNLMDRRTKIFREILNKMNVDQRILKEKTNFSEGVRLGANNIWQPTSSYREVFTDRERESMTVPDLTHSIYFKLVRSSWYFVMTYSEWLCYVILILNQALRSNFISLPIVLMTFCWGALTVPRPTKTFWIIIIAYMLIMLFIKNFFNMGLAPWSAESYEDDLFFPPAFMGLRNRNHLMNNLLLILIFFHRAVLQMLGLWKPFHYRTTSLINEGDYFYRNGRLVPVGGDTDKNSQVMSVKNEKIDIGDYFPKSIFHGLYKYAEPFKLYMQQLISPSSVQIPVDVYTPMFLCDLINFLLLTFFYGSFQGSEENGGLLQFINNNRVPLSFIAWILLYLFMMMIDRGLYLRRNRYGKLVFYFFQVIGYHIWLFVSYPMIAKWRLSKVTVVQAFYIFKCLYFLFSAYQIRNGYPTLISSHYLWHGYTMLHAFGYQLYRMLPYFLEIRCLLDWICSDSCLGIPGWFKLEDITQRLFNEKCQQEFEDKWSDAGAQPRSRVGKYLVGVFLFTLLVLLVIFPFLLFSLSSPMGVTTHPLNVKMELYMGRAEPVFVSYSTNKDRFILTEKDYQNLSSTFNNIPNSEDIFGVFTAEDIMVIKWSHHSLTTWDISPGSKKELLEELEKDEPFLFRLEIHYLHIGHGGEKSSRTFGQSTSIPPLPDPQRQTLINMVKPAITSETVISLPVVFPKFLMITKESKAVPLALMGNPGVNATTIPEVYSSEEDDDDDLPADARMMRNLLVTLRVGEENWWNVHEECTLEDDNYDYYLKNLVYNDCDEMTIYFFNEKVFSGALQFITQSGIIGLYLLYFMVVIEVVRGCVTEVGEIWLKSLPNTNRVLRKCMEVYVARDMGYYELEFDIFEELICIMRSREMLIKLTRFEDNNYDATFIAPGKSTTSTTSTASTLSDASSRKR